MHYHFRFFNILRTALRTWLGLFVCFVFVQVTIFSWLVAMYLCVHGTTSQVFFLSSVLCIIFSWLVAMYLCVHGTTSQGVFF
jgi:hypothetical protein